MQPAPTYEDRFVAFVDILGFKELIERTVGPSPGVSIGDIVAALAVPDESAPEGLVLAHVGDLGEADHRMSTFSDCIVISTEPTERGLMNLLVHVRAIASRLLRLRVLCRGGITRGMIYHDEHRVFGPAMIAAYVLESRVAVVPRVLVSREVVDFGTRAQDPIDRIFQGLTMNDVQRAHTSDTEGWYFVHYLWAFRMAADREVAPDPARTRLNGEIRGHFEREVARFEVAGREHERIKAEWFLAYFAWATDSTLLEALTEAYPRER